MNTASLIAKSSMARLSVTIAAMAVAFFMMPFLVTTLGDRWYGIWVILGGLTASYYLADIGMATAVTRFVTQAIAARDDHRANVIINTSLAVYGVLGLVIVLISLAVAGLAGTIVEDPADLKIVRIVIVLLGVNLALEFPFKAFSGIIGAYVRYDLLSYAHLGVLVLNTVFTVWLLSNGYGITALALTGVGCSQLSNVLFFTIARRLFSGMRFGRRFVEVEQAKNLFGYGLWSFGIQVGDQVRFRIDAVVIGWLLTAGHVTHFFVGARLAEYFVSLIFRATNFLTPLFTTYETQGRFDEIRAKLLFLTKISTILAVFGGGLMVILGGPFITRWMGTAYLDAYPVLVVLTVAMAVEAIQSPSVNVLYAIAKHPFLAKLTAVEALINLALSVALIPRYGIVGAAVGTAIPLVLVRGVAVPLYTCRAVGLSAVSYYGTLGRTALVTVIYLAVVYPLAAYVLSAADYLRIVAVAVAAMPVYLLAVFFLSFNRTERLWIRSALPTRSW